MLLLLVLHLFLAVYPAKSAQIYPCPSCNTTLVASTNNLRLDFEHRVPFLIAFNQSIVGFDLVKMEASRPQTAQRFNITAPFCSLPRFKEGSFYCFFNDIEVERATNLHFSFQAALKSPPKIFPISSNSDREIYPRFLTETWGDGVIYVAYALKEEIRIKQLNIKSGASHEWTVTMNSITQKISLAVSQEYLYVIWEEGSTHVLVETLFSLKHWKIISSATIEVHATVFLTWNLGDKLGSLLLKQTSAQNMVYVKAPNSTAILAKKLPPSTSIYDVKALNSELHVLWIDAKNHPSISYSAELLQLTQTNYTMSAYFTTVEKASTYFFWFPYQKKSAIYALKYDKTHPQEVPTEIILLNGKYGKIITACLPILLGILMLVL